MRILLATDAWEPQVNGVVRTLQSCVEELRNDGHEVEVLHPALCKTIPCPTYPEIRLALFPRAAVRRAADEFRPDAFHIATEGPIGLAARGLCTSRGWPFTTSFHTRFPEYIKARTGLPLKVSYGALRWFHRAATRVLVATESVERDLESRGFTNLARWSRGVDTELFVPRYDASLCELPRPMHMYVGRVAIEKNIQAFLDLELEGSKVVVGDGPQLDELKRRYPQVCFTGARFGEKLARSYAAADVFVFPSRTDTFGLVMLEALACGVPVAAYPVTGPIDVIGSNPVGVLNEDLGVACREARKIPRETCREFALEFSWKQCAHLLRDHLAPIPHNARAAG